MTKITTEPKEVQTEEVKTEAKYKFIKKFPTATKTYNVGDDCKETDENVIAYLLTNKYIK